MSGFSVFVLHLCVLACAFDASLAWSVDLPSRIKGLLGSCLVIPCSFDYTSNPPQRPDRVVWYQYRFIGYPLASDNWHPSDVISLFKGRTSVIASPKNCTLKIERVMRSDNGQRLYPWVDPDHIGRRTYRFFEKTVTIEVVDRAEDPKITITGDMKVGKSVTVQCSVFHTCSTNPPALSLNIPLKDDYIQHTHMKNGTTTTLTTTFVIQRDRQTVECSV
ncbi:sialoadhesin-like [Melanotaenia boesemani]|uniref:sialoadhesin-like n=1 Tax=Melanotaenia boesemani TaxID=1250792 RepID=UPI001C058F7C|nr:sialoadhesin-like [Melanotaenia boesemani]